MHKKYIKKKCNRLAEIEPAMEASGSASRSASAWKSARARRFFHRKVAGRLQWFS